MSAMTTWTGGPLANSGLWMMPPAPYLDFLDLMRHAVMVITDSGGVQEETTFLGVPCLTYRDTTERPVTVSMGTNRVVIRPSTVVAARPGSARGGPVRACRLSTFTAPTVGRPDGLEDRSDSQAGVGGRSSPAPGSVCLGDAERAFRAGSCDSRLAHMDGKQAFRRLRSV